MTQPSEIEEYTIGRINKSDPRVSSLFSSYGSCYSFLSRVRKLDPKITLIPARNLAILARGEFSGPFNTPSGRRGNYSKHFNPADRENVGHNFLVREGLIALPETNEYLFVRNSPLLEGEDLSNLKEAEAEWEKSVYFVPDGRRLYQDDEIPDDIDYMDVSWDDLEYVINPNKYLQKAEKDKSKPVKKRRVLKVQEPKLLILL